MFDNPIMKNLMDRYGHMEDLNELQDAMRRDGFGDLIDEINKNPEIVESLIEEYGEEIEKSQRHYLGSGVISVQEPVQGQPLGYGDSFKFDPRSCLMNCDGKCCKDRNYLMISYADILNLMRSPAVHHLKLFSTRDLFERQPPIIELFLAEEYDLYLPYLRFLPVDADADVRPEEAESNICPFLYPMDDVFSYYNLQLPEGTIKDAMGCILMNHKPMICQLSPVAQSRGMITGKLSFEYMPPIKNCPGCATNVEIPLSNYVSALISSSEKEERALFHSLIMVHHSRSKIGHDQKRFNSVLLEFYNIDHLLAMYGYSHAQRPSYERLMEILIAAAKGHFTPYNHFLQGLTDKTY